MPTHDRQSLLGIEDIECFRAVLYQSSPSTYGNHFLSFIANLNWIQQIVLVDLEKIRIVRLCLNNIVVEFAFPDSLYGKGDDDILLKAKNIKWPRIIIFLGNILNLSRDNKVSFFNALLWRLGSALKSKAGTILHPNHKGVDKATKKITAATR